MKKGMALFIVIIFVAVGAFFSILEWEKTKGAFADHTIGLVLGYEEIHGYEEPELEGEEIYLDIDFVRNHLYNKISLDKEGKRAFIELSNRSFLLEESSLTDFVQQGIESINIPIKIKEEKAYIPVNLLSKILEVEVQYLEASNKVIVDRFDDTFNTGEIVKEKAKLKQNDTILSFWVPTLKQGEIVKVFGQEHNSYQIRDQKGRLGLIEKEYVEISQEMSSWDKQLNQRREDFNKDGRTINLAWEYAKAKSPNLDEEEKIEALDVLVPTWFSLVNTEGTVINYADRKYVRKAHEKGYKVWGLVDNSFDPKLTSEILNSEALRKKVIAQLVMYASLYDLDGINIDFENVYYKDKDKLVQFVKELKNETLKQNLVLSMDITVPSSSENWSKVYDRKALGELLDYVAVMTYDEHWASSPVSGSVASIGWVQKGIERSMEHIPPEKILLGLPFYTRVWKESKEANGKIKVESKAVSMDTVQKLIHENNAELAWNEQAGQYYTEYYEGDQINKIWIEDSRSLALKTTLVEKYQLGGTAAWRRGFEQEEVWIVLGEITKNGKAYEELVFHK